MSKKTAIISIGNNDENLPAATTGENLTGIIKDLKLKGYETIVVVPPNDDPENGLPSYKSAIESAASAEGATVLPLVSATDFMEAGASLKLTTEKALEIKNRYPEATIIGDFNARKINLNSSTSVISSQATSGETYNNRDKISDISEGADEDGKEYITITEQDKKLLDLIAKYESGVLGYNAQWMGETDNRLCSMTLTDVEEKQNELVNREGRPGKSSAVGRYQFIRKTLDYCIKKAGLNDKKDIIRFTPEVQDALIIIRLEGFRKLKKWKAGKLSDEDFQLQLAMEFASVPVPFDVSKGSIGQYKGVPIPKTNLSQGQGFYDGDGINGVGHKGSNFTQALTDIRTGGAGKITKAVINADGTSVADPVTGASLKSTTDSATGNSNLMTGGRSTNAHPNKPLELQPINSTVYEYKPLEPHYNRYDFRLGKMVRDLRVNNGTIDSNHMSKTNSIGKADKVEDNFTSIYKGYPSFEERGRGIIDSATQLPAVTTAEQAISSANSINSELEKIGITDSNVKSNIIAMVEQQSALNPNATKSVAGFSNEQIRYEYGPLAENIPDSTLDAIKGDPNLFYDEIYADAGGSAFKPRGFIGLAGEDNYTKMSDKIGVDLVSNPDLVYDPTIGSKIAASYYEEASGVYDLTSMRNTYVATKGIDPNSPKEIENINNLKKRSDQFKDEFYLPDRQNTIKTNLSNPVSYYSEAFESRPAGTIGLSDKPLPTTKTVSSSPTSNTIWKSNTESKKQSSGYLPLANDDEFLEALASYETIESDGQIIDASTGSVIGEAPKDNDISYSSTGEVIVTKPGYEFMYNGSGAMENSLEKVKRNTYSNKAEAKKRLAELQLDPSDYEELSSDISTASDGRAQINAPGRTITGFYVPADFPYVENNLNEGDLFTGYLAEYDEATDSDVYIDYEILRADGTTELITF